MQNLTALFENPSAPYRGKPFWAWNAKLDEEELRRQIRIFKEMGFGGFFMHARVGLATPYLGKTWFDLIRSCIDEAKKTHMEAWLYDEDRYPSGAAGGLATRDPKYRSCALLLERYRDPSTFRWPTSDIIAFTFAVRFNEHEEIVSYHPLGAGQPIPDGHEVVRFVQTILPDNSWFNDTTYLDTLNPEAVAEFIRVTHERYRQEIGEHFGTTVPGIFSDEPNHTGVFRTVWHMPKSLPWTYAFANKFQEQFGYDIAAKLPEIAFNLAAKKHSQARYHYHLCKTKLFADAYAGQIGQWCHDHNMLYTGHVFEEDPISTVVSMVGGPMLFYNYMQAPGIDILTQYKIEYIAIKQCVSAARQMGRKWILSELYGCTGWETTFETYKHSGDWQAALGVNLRCPHLAFYSMAGEAKRDFPASIHFQSPWWQQFSYIEDYFSRIHVALTAGKADCRIAVIHPVESYYLLAHQGWTTNDLIEQNPIIDANIKRYDEEIETLVKWLLGNHLDFDFVDEAAAVDLNASVECDAQGPYLEVGQMRYRAVLVPPMITIRPSTLALLEQFTKHGGSVTFTGSIPSHRDALPCDAPALFAADKTVDFDEYAVVSALESARCLSVADPQGHELTDIYYQLRDDNGKKIVFVNNINRGQSHDAYLTLTVPIAADARLQRWDPATGQRYFYPCRTANNITRWNVHMPASGSALFMIATAEETLPPYPFYTPSGEPVQIAPATWDYLLHDHNVLMLDRPDITAESPGHPTFHRNRHEIIRIDAELRKHLGIRPRNGEMVQPWAAKEQSEGPAAEIVLDYAFDVHGLPSDTVLLAMERPRHWTITLNESPIDTLAVNGWWVDKAIETIPVAPAVFKEGRNLLRMRGTFDCRCDLEYVYLLGAFGVELQGADAAITQLPPRLVLGDWTRQGLPFYSHAVTYQTTFEYCLDKRQAVFLSLPHCRATVAEVSINDSEPKVMAFPEDALDVTDFLKNGKNTLDIKVISSRRNAFGPFHVTVDDEFAVGPDSYRGFPHNWQEAIRVRPYGLMEPPVLQSKIKRSSHSDSV